jgi:hypothetical protein
MKSGTTETRAARQATQPRVALAHAGAEGPHEVVGEQQHVVPALPERRQVHREDVEAVEEVLAEPSGRHVALQVPVRRRDDPDIGPQRGGPANPLELALLEDPQELGLDGQRQLRDLVEEQRPARGQLEAPGLLAIGAGEGAPLVAEQLGLQQGLGERGAVHRHEGTFHAGARVMDGSRYQLLAGPALAHDQGGGLGGGHLGGAVEGLPQRSGAADDLIEPVALAQLRPQ